jgi:hypothetical protein
LSDLLDRVTLEMSGAKPAARFVVSELSLGSAVTAILPETIDKDHPDVGKEVMVVVFDGLSKIEDGADPGEVFSPEAVEPTEVVVSAFRFGAVDIDMKLGGRERRLTAEGAGRRPQGRPGSRSSIGSIEGVVQTIATRDDPYFRVYRRRGGGSVACYFDLSMIEVVRKALLRRVFVSGRITRRADGQPISVRQITAIRLLDDDDLLPPIDEVVGIEPDLTSGLAAEEWLARRRNGAEA